MDTKEIEDVLNKHMDKEVFKGVHSASQLPVMGKKIHYPFCFVCNTDNGKKSGLHWVAFYFDCRGKGHYFDSFGSYPYHKEWVNYLTGHSYVGDWDFCRAEVQPLDSDACGHYCIYYLMMRHHTPLDVSDYVLVSGVKEEDAKDFFNNKIL